MVKGFIIYPTYKVVNNQAHIYLFGRLENGQSFVTINKFQPYFFIKTHDLKKAEKLWKIPKTEQTPYTNFHKENVSKLTFHIPSEIPKAREVFQEENIECYEADIRFEYRFLIDKKIQGSIDIEGEYESNDFIDRIYTEPKISPINYSPRNLKILSLDIETSIDGKKLYCISLYGENYKKSFIISNSQFKNTSSYSDESSLLEDFKKEIQKEDPDIITGWNVIDFDLDFLLKKYNQHELPFQIGRDNSQVKLRLQKGFFRDSKAEISGRVVLDGLSLLKSSFIKVRDYKLDTVAQDILKQKKLIKQEDKGKIDELYKKNQQYLLDYNQNDAQLVYDILKKSQTLELSIQRSISTGMPLDRVSASIASFDSLYLKKARERNLVVPTGKFSEKPSPITGGFVMESKPGIYDNILVFDFKSLYPSLMRTFNLDPASFLGKKKEKNAIESPNGVYFRNEKGIVPEIISALLKEREKAREDKNELSRYAIKILMNSFFGIMASPSCRFFNMDFANAITHFGQYIIKLTAKKIEEQGYEVIYSDTDSVFINSKLESEDQATKRGKFIETKINSFYKEFIKKEYNRESFLELEFEKNYIRFLMPKIRSGEKGAKKKYAGLKRINGKEEIEIVGLEAKRTDWTEAAHEFQKELLNKVFYKQEISEFVKKFIKDIREGKYDDKLLYRKQLRKTESAYVKTTPPHVKAIRKLKNFNGRIVEYYLTTDGPETKQTLKHKLDYDHYIAKQIKPIAEMILVFFNLNFDDIVKGSKQVKLFDFK